jgi:hypothetical protein
VEELALRRYRSLLESGGHDDLNLVDDADIGQSFFTEGFTAGYRRSRLRFELDGLEVCRELDSAGKGLAESQNLSKHGQRKTPFELEGGFVSLTVFQRRRIGRGLVESRSQRTGWPNVSMTLEARRYRQIEQPAGGLGGKRWRPGPPLCRVAVGS